MVCAFLVQSFTIPYNRLKSNKTVSFSWWIILSALSPLCLVFFYSCFLSVRHITSPHSNCSTCWFYMKSPLLQSESKGGPHLGSSPLVYACDCTFFIPSCNESASGSPTCLGSQAFACLKCHQTEPLAALLETLSAKVACRIEHILPC